MDRELSIVIESEHQQASEDGECGVFIAHCPGREREEREKMKRKKVQTRKMPVIISAIRIL